MCIENAIICLSRTGHMAVSYDSVQAQPQTIGLIKTFHGLHCVSRCQEKHHLRGFKIIGLAASRLVKYRLAASRLVNSHIKKIGSPLRGSMINMGQRKKLGFTNL